MCPLITSVFSIVYYPLSTYRMVKGDTFRMYKHILSFLFLFSLTKQISLVRKNSHSFDKEISHKILYQPVFSQNSPYLHFYYLILSLCYISTWLKKINVLSTIYNSQYSISQYICVSLYINLVYFVFWN